MTLQTAIAILLVLVCAAFLLRRAVESARGFLSDKGGCSSGCGKCGFAADLASRPRKHQPRPRPESVIPLEDASRRPRA